MKREMICIVCPIGCHLSVELNNLNEVIKVEGNACLRGEKYAQKECTAPTRALTSTVKIAHGIHPVLPVISSSDIPKERVMDVMNEINRITINAPVKMNDVIINKVCGLDVNIVASRDMDRQL